MVSILVSLFFNLILQVKEIVGLKGLVTLFYQNIDYIDSVNPEYVLILSGDHIYKMDYDDMLQSHKDNNASLTVAVFDVPLKEASRFGIMNTDANNRIVEFEEKPAQSKIYKGFYGYLHL